MSYCAHLISFSYDEGCAVLTRIYAFTHLYRLSGILITATHNQVLPIFRQTERFPPAHSTVLIPASDRARGMNSGQESSLYYYFIYVFFTPGIYAIFTVTAQ